MLNQLLPRQVDNMYHGYKLGLWLFGVLLLMKSTMSLNSIFNGRMVASSADGIPLDTFTPAGAQTVVALFAIWGLAHLAFCALGFVALVRYRALVPFLFLLLLVEQLSRKLVLQVIPVARVGTPPAFLVNLILLTLMASGLALSLGRRRA
jgi:hypothetical protein